MRDVLQATGWHPVVANAALTIVVIVLVVWVAFLAALAQQDLLDEEG